MPRKPKVPQLGPVVSKQVEEWLQAGKSARWIAARVHDEAGNPLSYSAIYRFGQKLGLISKHNVTEAIALRIKSVDEALDLLGRTLEFLDTQDLKEGLSMAQKNLLSEKGAWVDRIARLQGWTKEAPEVKVAIQVNIYQEVYQDMARRLRVMVDDGELRPDQHDAILVVLAEEVKDAGIN